MKGKQVGDVYVSLVTDCCRPGECFETTFFGQCLRVQVMNLGEYVLSSVKAQLKVLEVL